MPTKQESFLDKLKRKFVKPTTEWGEGLAKQYESPKKDTRPFKDQLKDMFDPAQSGFAKFVSDRFKKKAATR